MFPAENLSSLYHLNSNQQDSGKITQADLSNYRLPSTASTSGFNSNESAILASYPQNGYESPSRFLSLSSNEASPAKMYHFNKDYQESPFGFTELSYAPAISYLQQGRNHEESRPTHINTDTIFDPFKEDFNLDLQDAQDIEEEIDAIRVEQPIQNTQNQPKKKIFTIIRQDAKTKMETERERETEMEMEIETEKPNHSYQLKNAPGHLFTAIKNGVGYYSDSKNDYFPSVTQKLRELSPPRVKAFNQFMHGYHGTGKTFKSLGMYFNKKRKTPENIETLGLLKTILIAFLRNPEDVEKWFENSRMEDHTKESIRQNLQKLETDFLKILNGETL